MKKVKKQILIPIVAVALAVLILVIVLLVPTSNKSIGGYDYSKPGNNQDGVLRIVGGWTKTGVGTHFHSGPDAGPGIIFAVEGCMQYVRTSDEFFYLVAESFVHNTDGTSILTIRDNAKWHDGSNVVAMDIKSYYIMNITDFGKYIMDLIVLDETDVGIENAKKLKVIWKPWREPTDYAKNMLLAMDTKNVSVQYKTFKNIVDQSLDLIYNGTNGVASALITENSDGIGEIRLGRHINPVSAALGSLYSTFRATVVGSGPKDYMGTGPFIMETVTENQMILVKNNNYYLSDSVKFDKIIATQYSNDNQRYADMKSGKLDYVDGVMPKDINENILKENKNMVSYKFYDQGAIGMYYNMEKQIWQNDKVREAFQYIFNREAIKQTIMPYGKTSFKPMMIMSPIEARQYMSVEAYDLIKNYSFDQTKATLLLAEAGWKKVGKNWHDTNNSPVTITLGYENIATFLKIAQIVKAELEKFGINVVLKSGSDWGTWFSIASSPNSTYDCVVAFTELNTFGTHPAGSMKHFFDVLQAHVLHLPLDKETEKFNLQVDFLSPNDKNNSIGKISAYQVYQNMYIYSGTTLENYVDSIVLGFSRLNYGIQFFENVTGSYFNADKVGGLPSADIMSINRNMEYVPDFFEDNYKEYALLNVHFTQAAPYSTGLIYAKK